jgi:hypothetical protein
MDNRKRRAHGELERRLEAYAAARLSPDPIRMILVRTAIMADARRALGHSMAVPLAAVPMGSRASRPRLFGDWRRLSVALAAASLSGLLLVGTAFAASRAGAPLYGVRVWLEAATMPTDRDARAAAEISRLQSRLGDVADGVARGDGSAVSAALAEYRASVESSLATAGDDHDILARLEIELMRHRVVLTTLLGLVPSDAQDAIQEVLDRDQHALDAIRQRGQPGSNGTGAPVGKPGSGGPAQPTQKPAAQPTPPDHPQPTAARPEHTPRGGQEPHAAGRGRN